LKNRKSWKSLFFSARRRVTADMQCTHALAASEYLFASIRAELSLQGASSELKVFEYGDWSAQMLHSMLQGKQTVKPSVLDMLRNSAPQAESTAKKRSCPSIIDEDFEDFAPPPPRKFSSLTTTHSQKMNASSATLLNASKKIVGRPPFAGAASSGSRQLDEVGYLSSATTFKCMLVFTT
jgi:hypothetical protein